MEVASPHTYRNDIGPKREGYQSYGVSRILAINLTGPAANTTRKPWPGTD